MGRQVRIIPWTSNLPPSEKAIQLLLAEENLSAYPWSNGPFDVYAAHSHSYNKVIYVVRGSITFGLPQENRKLTLNPGDRLDLPAGIVHDAEVGPEGVACLEAHT